MGLAGIRIKGVAGHLVQSQMNSKIRRKRLKRGGGTWGKPWRNSMGFVYCGRQESNLHSVRN